MVVEFADHRRRRPSEASRRRESDSIGCRILVDGVVKAREDHERSERLYLLHAEGRMSNHQLHNSRPFIARTIHRLSMPIILAWLAIIVI